MNVAAELNVDSLMDAYLARNKYKDAHQDLRNYHEKRFQLLQSLFGCDLEKLKAQLGSESRSVKGKANAKYSNIDGRAVIHFMEDCVRLLNSSKSPFRHGIYLEGKPPKLVTDLSAKYEKKVDHLEGRIDQINREVLRDILIFFFSWNRK